MSIRTMSMMVAACVATGAAFAETDVTNVRRVNTGETVYTKGAGNVVGEINKNSDMPTNALHYAGTHPVIDMQAGSTLVITNGTSIWTGFVITNGAVTVVADKGGQLKFQRGIVIRGEGELIISNATSATFGHSGSTYNDKSVYVGEEFSGANKMYYDTRRVRFMKDGEFVPGTLNYEHARIINFPDADCNVTVASTGTKPMNWLCGTSADFKDQVTNYVGNVAPACVMTAETAPAGHTLTVPSGKILTFEPTTNCDDSVERQVRVDVEGIATLVDPATNFVFAGNLKLASATSVISNNEALADITFTGSLTGAGRVRLPIGGNNKNNPMHRTFGGDVSGFTGTFEINSTIGSVTQKVFGELVVSNSLANATVNVGPNVAFAPAGTDEPYAVKALNGTALLASTLKVAANQRVQIGTAGGTLTFTGAGAAVSEVNILAWASGFAYTADDQVTVTFGAERTTALPAGTAVVTSSKGDQTLIFPPSTAGVADLAAIKAQAAAYGLTSVAIDVVNGSTLKNTTEANIARVAEGDAVTISETNSTASSIAGAGTLNLVNPIDDPKEDWKASADFWYDFSKLENCKRPGETPSSKASTAPDNPTVSFQPSTKASSFKYPLIERVIDQCHPDVVTGAGMGNGFLNGNDYTAVVFPFVVTNAYVDAEGNARDLAYLSMGPNGSNRRINVYNKWSDGNSGNNIAVQHIFMVFGSSNGGGTSILGYNIDKDPSPNKYGRTNGITNPFFTNELANITFYTNGIAVAENVACPNGGWQLLTFDMNGEEFSGLGRGFKKNTANGGCDFGEVIIFKTKVSDMTRKGVEYYLAKKWGLPYDFKGAEKLFAEERAARVAAITNTVSAVGAPTVVASECATKLRGNFAGTIQLAGGKLLVGDEALPYSEAQVAAVPSRVFWVDGDDRASVKLTADYGDRDYTNTWLECQQVRVVKDKTDADFHAGPLMAGISQRMPYWMEAARGLGPTRHWLDFFDYCRQKDGGNTLRMIKPYASEDWRVISNNKQTYPVQTILFAHDSSFGGGTPVLDQVSCNGNIGMRQTLDPAAQVWNDGSATKTCEFFRDGVNRIDGVTQTNPNGFGGKPEVYAVRGTTPFEMQCYIDYFGNSENKGDTRYAACVGEMLYFSSALEMADIQGIEAYLMQKWLGTLPTGFADVRQATVSGNGTVEVTDAAKMPTLASDFTGTVNVGGETGTLAMTLDADAAVAGALVNTGATINLPATMTLDVSLASGLSRRDLSGQTFTLVDAAIQGVETWTVNVGVGLPANFYTVEQKTEGGRTVITLTVKPLGLILMVK